MDEIIELIDTLATVHNRALALGVNLDPHTTEAAKLLNAAWDDRSKVERAQLFDAFRRPATDSVQ